MARARNIKPGFFRNADLVELPYEARLLFIGLWTIADRAGRLEDRPKQIKMELFPADNMDCDGLLDQLANIGVVIRYEHGGKRYLQVVNFAKHQNPHKEEKVSSIPAAGEVDAAELVPLDEQDAGTVQAPYSDDGDTMAIGLIPDSLIPDSRSLNPESINTPLPPKGGKRVARIDPDEEPEGFATWYALYRRKDAKRDAIKAWRQLDPDPLLQARMVSAVVSWKWAEDPSKIPLPASWIRGQRWEDQGVVAARPPDGQAEWLQAAGFSHIAEAQNARCHIGNYRQFRDGKRIAEGVPA